MNLQDYSHDCHVENFTLGSFGEKMIEDPAGIFECLKKIKQGGEKRKLEFITMPLHDLNLLRVRLH